MIKITEGTLTERVSSTERVIHNPYSGSGITRVHELVVERTGELEVVGKALSTSSKNLLNSSSEKNSNPDWFMLLVAERNVGVL